MADPVVKSAWTPQPGPQTAACSCPVEDLSYGGARGGGKTDFLIGDFAGHAGRYGKAARGILFRRTYDELADIISRSHEIYPKLGAEYRVKEREWSFPNGAFLRLRYLDHDLDADHYQGHQYSWMGFDQLEQWMNKEPIDKLWGSVRSPHGVPCYRRSTWNPPAPRWIIERYYESAAPFTPFKFQPQPDLRPDIWIQAVFIPAQLEDNPLLLNNDPQYENRLAAAGGEALWRAWRHGDVYAMIGQVFSEWREPYHVLNEFSPPAHWEFVAGLDWGYRKPGWFGIAACSPDGDVVVVDEMYFRELYAEQAGYQAGLMCQAWGYVSYAASDDQMWQESGIKAPTLAEEFQLGLFQAYGDERRDRAPVVIQAVKGAGSRYAKKQLMHRYLAWSETETNGKKVMHPWDRPRLRFTRKCQAAIRTIPFLPYDQHKPEDVDTEAEDHPYDGVCNILMSRPPLPERLESPKDYDNIHPGMDRTGRKRPWQEALEPKERGTGWRVPREYVPLGEGEI